MTNAQKAQWAAAIVAAVLLWNALASLGLIALAGLWENAQRIPPIYLPAQWALFAINYWSYYDMPRNLGMSGILASLVVVAGLVRMKDRIGNGLPLHGETKWLTKADAKKAGFVFTLKPHPEALNLGKWGPWYVSIPGQEHAALYARTRSGKGVGFVNPNAMIWGGGLLAFSIKRDIVRETAAAREAMGDEVFVFDVTAPGGCTHRWNPLGLVRRGTYHASSDIQRVMYGLVPPTKAQNPYWDNAARKIAAAAALMVSETPSMTLNVQTVLRTIARHDYDTFIRNLIQQARRDQKPYPVSVVDTLLSWLDRKGETDASSVRETMTTALKLWDDPIVQAATEVSDFDFSKIRSKRMSIFVCAQPGDLRWLQLIYGIFFDQFVAVNTREEYREDPTHIHQVLVELDEFWALGKRDILADAAAFTASFGFRMAYVLQSKSQVRTTFGDEGAKNLFLNTGVECLFGGTDQDTAEEVSKRMGMDTVTETTKSGPRWMSWLHPQKQSQSEAARRRALMLPQEITRMDRNIMIVLRPGFMPLQLQRIVHYEDPYFSKLGGPPPTIAPLKVVVEMDDVPAALDTQKADQENALAAMQNKQAEEEKAKEDERKAAIAALHEAQEREVVLQEAHEEALQAAAEAAADSAKASERSRLAKAESTDVARSYRAANLALTEATELGVVPPAVQAAADTWRERAQFAALMAERLAAEAAVATQASQEAKRFANQRGRERVAAERRAIGLAQAMAAAGITEEAA